MSDKDEKKFANLHYPGMKVDPNEALEFNASLASGETGGVGRRVIDPELRWRFAEQIVCIGESNQYALSKSSAFVLAANSLGVRVAKKLLSLGFGRVGMFGEYALTGSADLRKPEGEEVKGALANLSKWAKIETPWANFEPFRDSSIDRQIDDMARGFHFLISCADLKTVGLTISLARSNNLPAIVAGVSGKKGWCAYLPPGKICENCLEHPLDKEQPGLYFPLLDLMSTWIGTAVFEAVLNPPSAESAYLEIFDATHTPWMRETIALKPQAGCKTCSAKN